MEKVIGLESIESMLAAIKPSTKDRAKGVFTVKEMRAQTGHSEKWCREQISLLQAAGKARCVGPIPAIRIDGQPTTVPGYMLTKR